MNKLKDAMAKCDGKYVNVEALTDVERQNTYGGAVSSVILKYGVPPIVKYGLPPINPPIIKQGVSCGDGKITAPVMPYGCPDIEIIDRN